MGFIFKTVTLAAVAPGKNDDWHMDSANNTVNYGGTSPGDLTVGVNTGTFRSILSWDTIFRAGVPRSAFITAATLTLNIVDAATAADDECIVELISSASTVVDGEITHDRRSTATAWSSAGGDIISGAPTVDFFMPDSTGSFAISGLQTMMNYTRTYNVAADRGIFMIRLAKVTSSDFFTFDRAEGVGTPPALSVTYRVPDDTPELVGGGYLRRLQIRGKR